MPPWPLKDTHRWVRRELSAYLDGRLEAAAARRMEAHLVGCARCREELESLRDTVAALAALPQTPAPRSFRLTPKDVERSKATPVWVGWLPALRLASAAATVLLLMVLGADALLYPPALPAPAAMGLAAQAPKEGITREAAQQVPPAVEGTPAPTLRDAAPGAGPAPAPVASQPGTPAVAPDRATDGGAGAPALRRIAMFLVALALMLLGATAGLTLARRVRGY